jgi:F420-dependent methylenetetrahydromethanopterin dehydrogenase
MYNDIVMGMLEDGFPMYNGNKDVFVTAFMNCNAELVDLLAAKSTSHLMTYYLDVLVRSRTHSDLDVSRMVMILLGRIRPNRATMCFANRHSMVYTVDAMRFHADLTDFDVDGCFEHDYDPQERIDIGDHIMSAEERKKVLRAFRVC